VWGSQEGCAEAVRLLRRSTWKPKAIYISSSQGINKALRDLSSREMDGTFTTVPWEIRIAKAFPGGEAFVERFRSAYRQDPDSMAASSYAGGQILEAAVAKAQSLDKNKIRQSLTGLETVTILGRYGVDPSGMQLRQFPLTLQWQKGKREIVWPDEMRTAKPAIAR
jgi:branched-chain amino acid transport system substrate-binding protein